MTRTEYFKEYVKDNYKTVKVYIAKEDYEKIEKHLKTINPKIKMSGYIKSLIEKDLREGLGGGNLENE